MMFERNTSLREVTTFKIGGPAGFFCRVKSEEELAEALLYAKTKELPVLVLGGGSNILVRDDGFSGLVIKIELSGIKFGEEQDGAYEVTVGAGESWDRFVAATIERGLYGLENLSGIPGTVGGAPVQNIGAYGVEIKTTLVRLVALSVRTGAPRVFENADCGFGYRKSFFQSAEGKHFIITRVTFKLAKSGVLNTSYADIARTLADRDPKTVSLSEVRSIVLGIRAKKFPDLATCGTAGSFFKNPVIAEAEFARLKKEFPELPGYPAGRGKVKISLAWILDKVCGLVGYREGAVGLFQAQPLVLVNYGGASASDVEHFAAKVADKVKDRTGIAIVWEVNRF